MSMRNETGKPIKSSATGQPDGRKPSEMLDDFEKILKRRIKAFDLRVMDNKRAMEKVRDDLRTFLDLCRESLERKFAELDRQVGLIEKKVEAYTRQRGMENPED